MTYPSQSVDEIVQQTQRRLYWERNALVTCVVLVVSVALSALARPIGWQLLVGCGLGGVMIYFADVVADHDGGFLALALLLAGIGVSAWAMAASGIGKGSLMWTQGGGIIGAALCACMVLSRLLRTAASSKTSAPPKRG